MLRTTVFVLAIAAVLPRSAAAGADPIQSLLSPKGPCAGKTAGDACSVSLEGHAFAGICVALPTGGLACVPAPPSTYCPSPTICGDGIVSAGEACDPGGAGFTPTCNINCTSSACGDGIVNPAAGEQCDAGGQTDTAICNMGSGAGEVRCTIARCGDGYVNVSAGEQCDDGGGAGGWCNANCTLAMCGDGIVNAALGEQCDDGPQGSATCTPECTLKL